MEKYEDKNIENFCIVCGDPAISNILCNIHNKCTRCYSERSDIASENYYIYYDQYICEDCYYDKIMSSNEEIYNQSIVDDADRKYEEWKANNLI